MLSISLRAQQEEGKVVTGEEKIKQIIFSIFNKNYAENKANYAQIKEESLIQDLNINEIVRYFNCQTLMGRIFLFNALIRPLNNDTIDQHKTIKKRIWAIRLLITNPEIKKTVEDLLKKANDNEKEVTKVLDSRTKDRLTKVNIKTADDYVYSKMPGAIQKTHSWISWAWTICHDFLFIKNVVKALSSGNINANLVSESYAKAIEQGNILKALSSVTFYDVQSYLIFRATLTLPSIGISIYRLYNDPEFVKCLDALHSLVAAADKIQKTHYYFNMNKKQTLNQEENLALQYMKNFPQKSFFSPSVNNFLKHDFYGKEHALTDTIYTIAELDAYNAIATKFLEAENSNNPFCFTTFLPNQDPYISINAGWNVLINNGIANDVTEDKNIILTGPNAGGKSSWSRMILQNIILSQVFGIAAAAQCAITPFHIIHSHINIVDDQIKGDSLFKAELNAAKAEHHTLETLPDDHRCFLLFDELFKGTDSKTGEELAQRYLETIGLPKKKLFLIFGSHFEKIKQLAIHNPEKFANYKVDQPIFDTEGNLKYSFKISKGMSTASIGLKLAEHMNIFKPL